MLTEFIKRLKDSQRLSQFLIIVSFLITFAIVRTITHLQKLNILPNQHNDILHVHHLVPGIILLLISGYIGISFWSVHKIRLLMAVLFGIGAALTIDEFALWLYLRDVYWAKQGRDSIDAIIVAILITIIILLISEVHDHSWIKRLLKRK
jgi:chromate transport protein ChrA